MTADTKGTSKYITRERAILILCFGIALVFWLLVNLSKTFSTSKIYPVAYNLPASTSLLNNPPKSINAEIAGIGWNLLSHYLGSEENQITFELEGGLTYHFSYEELKNQVQADLGQKLEVLGLSTSQIRIELDSSFSKNLKVILAHRIQFADGYYFMDQLKAFPHEIKVTGPKSIVSSLEDWNSQLIEIENVKKDIELEVKLEVPDHPSISISNPSVVVKAAVEEFTQKSIFIPVIIINQKDSVKIFPEKIKLDFVVGLSKFDEIVPEDFEVVADFEQRYSDDQMELLPVNLKKQPPKIMNLQLSPAEVEFFIVE